MKRPSAKRILLLLLGIGLLGILVWRAGPDEIATGIRGVGWGFLWLLLLALAWNTLAALAWRLLFDRDHPSMGWRRLWYTRICGESVNTLTPFLNLGGEPVKIWLMREHLEADQGTTYVLLDKTVYFLASLLYMATGLAVGIVVFHDHPLVLSLSAGLLALWVAGLLYVIRRQARGHTVLAVLDLLERLRVRTSPEFRQRMRWVDEDLAAFWQQHHARFLAALAVHFLGRVLRAVDVILIAHLLGLAIAPAAAYFISAAAVLINTAFAFIPGALGAYEGGHGYLLHLLGMGMGAGLTLGIIRRVRTITFAGLSYLLLVFRPARPGPMGVGAAAGSQEAHP